MTPTRLDADWLADPALAAVAKAVAGPDEEVRVVGGAVRNALMGLPVADIDLATTARPETVAARLTAAGLGAVPTGLVHGTVTAVADGHTFEVTTLRSDVETDGRRATVAFTRDWAEDAARRDFTMNAVYAALDGTLSDPVGGIADAEARVVRFIGEPEARIREDYLRILRFFRFHAVYGRSEPDAAALSACIRLRAGLAGLSRERVGQEMRKLVMGARAAGTTRLLQDSGLMDFVIAGVALPERLARLLAVTARAGETAEARLRLAALAAFTEDDSVRLTERLRLSNSDRARIAALPALARRLMRDRGEAACRTLVYELGNGPAVEAGLFAWVDSAAVTDDGGWLAAVRTLATWQAPRFPVTGADLLAAGASPGPEIGRRLSAMEAAWIAGGFAATREDLLATY